MKISDNTAISMPMRNLLSIMAAVAVGVWAYFGVIERLTLLEMENALLTKDLEQAEERLHYKNTQPLWKLDNISKGNCTFSSRSYSYSCFYGFIFTLRLLKKKIKFF